MPASCARRTRPTMSVRVLEPLEHPAQQPFGLHRPAVGRGQRAGEAPLEVGHLDLAALEACTGL